MELNTTRLKNGPIEALKIADRVCGRYYEVGCPETNFRQEEDGWYSEGPQSGGTVVYTLSDLNQPTGPVYQHTEGNVVDAFEEGDPEAVLKVKWGRHVITGPGRFKIQVSYPEQWVPVKGIGTIYADSFQRRFVPAHIKAETIPHLAANPEQIFEWINKFANHPRDATAAPGVEFFAGEKGVEQVKSEVLNIFLSEDKADVISPEYLTSRFEISFEYAYNLLQQQYFDGKIAKLETPAQYHGHTLYGSATDWDDGDTIENGDELLVKYRP